MESDFQSRLKTLVTKYKEERQILNNFHLQVKSLRETSKHRFVGVSEWTTIIEDIHKQRSTFEKIKEELFQILIRNKLLIINDPVLISQLKQISSEVRNYYKSNPYKRWDAYGPLDEDEWDDWIDEIEINIHDRPWSDSLHDLVNTINPLDFTDRGYEIFAIILNDNIPNEFRILFCDIDLSYRFGLFNSVLVCCRSLIEIGIKNYYEKIKYHKYNDAKENKEVSLQWLIDSLGETIQLNKTDLKKAHSVRLKANGILHSGAAISQKDALKSIKNTQYIIKRLYDNIGINV